ASADFNGDGVPDLVWQSPSTGAAQIWYMGGGNGATFLSAASVSTGNSWRITTAAKYPVTISGSASNAYLVWEDPVAGAVQFWYESTSQSSPQPLSAVTVSASTPWRIVAAADSNQDGIPDAVWQNPSGGAVQIWLMGGSLGATYMSTAQVTEANTWHVVAAADFNGDGVAAQAESPPAHSP
ncbi:MAG: VCBS repeat-containing protein, partial [Bryobacteraceae bacterium]